MNDPKSNPWGGDKALLVIPGYFSGIVDQALGEFTELEKTNDGMRATERDTLESQEIRK